MKSSYIIKCGAFRIAIADLSPIFKETESNSWLVTRVNVPQQYRGTGIGTQLIDMVMTDADKNQATLYLEILPSGPMNYNQLMAWYKKRGFVQIKRGFFKRVPC